MGNVETLVQVAVEKLPPENIQEVALEAGALNAHRIKLILRVDLVFLRGSIEYFLVLISHVAVGVHELVDHLLLDNRIGGQVFDNDIFHAEDGLSAHSNVYMRDFCLQGTGKFLYNIRQALSGLVDIVHNALADERRRILLNNSQYLDAAVHILLSGDTGHLR